MGEWKLNVCIPNGAPLLIFICLLEAVLDRQTPTTNLGKQPGDDTCKQIKRGGKVGLAKLTVRPTPCRPHSQPPSAFFCFREELRWSIRTFARGQSLRSRMGKWWHFGKTFGLMKHSYALHFLGSALAAATKILWSINAFIQGEIPKKMLVQILNLSILPHSKKIKIFFRYNV